jgi:tetratricopeptide (TPR) repeat protein
MTMNINEQLQSAFQYIQSGDLRQAEQAYSQILTLEPNNGEACLSLGILYYRFGNYDLSIQHIKRALEINADNSIAHYNLGIAYGAKGQIERAIDCYQNALKYNPSLAPAYYNLGNIFRERLDVDNAITYYQNALKYNPSLAPAYYNLGNIFRERLQIDEAITYYQNALKVDPNFVFAFTNLGNAFRQRGQLDEAIDCYKKALKLDSHLAHTHTSLGLSLQEKGMVDEAFKHCKIALQLNPHLPEAHWNLSHMYLLQGNFREGWKEYEWRWGLKDYYQYKIFQALWDGSDISQRTILIHDEQGFGDTIQFVRYVPLVAQRGAKVIIGCKRELVPLLQRVEGVSQVIARGEPLPEFDVHCPILSLPLLFNTTLDTLPANIPYISTDPLLAQKWRNIIRHDNSKLKIGLVWAGRPEHQNDRNRSGFFDMFASLAQLNNSSFYSLQKGEAAKQRKYHPDGINIIDYTNRLDDFSETAALIENLDLIISVDTAVAHLAGALGKPVWVLIPFAPDWRWMLDREDSPWYPTMKLFRQSSCGDWDSAISTVLDQVQKSFMKI